MITLSKDNKKLLKYLGILFILGLSAYKLPHDSYSIIQYIIRPIRYKNSTIYLSGIVPLDLNIKFKTFLYLKEVYIWIKKI